MTQNTTNSQLVEDYRQSFQRAFKDQDLTTTWIRMDGWIMRDNSFLRDGWNYAIDQGWLRVETVELEQETFLKGFLTEKGQKEVLNESI